MEELKSKILSRVTVDDTTGCWNWMGHKNKKGYGGIRYKGFEWRAHRLSYTAHKGAIPEGLFVCHKCDNPSCINPEHLFLGTHRENMEDAKRKRSTLHPSLSSYTSGCRCVECKLEMHKYYVDKVKNKKRAA